MRTLVIWTVLLTGLSLAPIVTAGQDIKASKPERAVVAKALRLVPRGNTLKVTVIDPDLTGDPVAVRRLDAFVVREASGELRQAVYLNQESALLQAAVKGSDFHVKILAAVIHHEVAHLDGLDEPSAARAEREFFEHLMASGLVGRAEGLAHLRSLRSAASE